MTITAPLPPPAAGTAPPARREPGPLRGLVAPATWKRTAYLLSNLAAGTITFTLTVPGMVGTAATVPLFPMAVLGAWVFIAVTRGLGRLERLRAWILLDLDIAYPHPDDRGASWWRRLWNRVGRASTWKEVAHLVLGLPIGAVTFALTMAVWTIPLTLLTLPAYAWALPNDRADLGFMTIPAGWGSVLPALAGAVALLFVPLVIRLLASVDGRFARWALGRSRRYDLGARVAVLETSRSRVVDAAEAERRRIERDLHDGAQQRLVALAMDLGMARERLATDPEKARQLLDEAHAEAKQALTELRNLARGIHPAVLTDRGLDAALSAVAARSPIPVDLRVDVGGRCGPNIESIAYFVVSESLANVAKHAGASRATVQVARRGNRLVIEVSDDGHGGADPTLGTGLAGLQDRVAGVDGWMHVSSPIGGPTTLFVELPCGS
jgi:signal transduction histidine kinase